MRGATTAAPSRALQKAIYAPFIQETGINVEVTNIVGTQMPAQIKQGHPQFSL